MMDADDDDDDGPHDQDDDGCEFGGGKVMAMMKLVRMGTTMLEVMVSMAQLMDTMKFLRMKTMMLKTIFTHIYIYIYIYIYTYIHTYVYIYIYICGIYNSSCRWLERPVAAGPAESVVCSDRYGQLIATLSDGDGDDGGDDDHDNEAAADDDDDDDEK